MPRSGDPARGRSSTAESAALVQIHGRLVEPEAVAEVVQSTGGIRGWPPRTGRMPEARCVREPPGEPNQTTVQRAGQRFTRLDRTARPGASPHGTIMSGLLAHESDLVAVDAREAPRVRHIERQM